MAVEFNHTIVSARFLTEVLGLPAARPFGHFLVVELANGVTLDFIAGGTADPAACPEHFPGSHTL